jgi:hypothetical protein
MASALCPGRKPSSTRARNRTIHCPSKIRRNNSRARAVDVSLIVVQQSGVWQWDWVFLMQPVTFRKVWYLPDENRWSGLKLLDFRDVGQLTLYDDFMEFTGIKHHATIRRIRRVSRGKRGRDSLENWIKVEYGDRRIPSTAYFSDGRWLGWVRLFRGTRWMLNALCDRYSNLSAGTRTPTQAHAAVDEIPMRRMYCSLCRLRLKYPEDLSEMCVKCPKCGHRFRLPPLAATHDVVA